MKKILAILVMLFSSLVMVTVVTSPAQAATCSAFVTKHSADLEVVKYATKWVFNSHIRYRECVGANQFYEIDSLEVSAVKAAGYPSCDGTVTIADWTVNPDGLSGWNPSAQFKDCTTGLLAFYKNWSSGSPMEKVYPGDTEAQRCMKVDITYHWIASPPVYSEHVIPRVCFNFPF